jgi:hypothetical protein
MCIETWRYYYYPQHCTRQIVFREDPPRLPRHFRWTTRVPNSPVYVNLYIIYSAVEVSLEHPPDNRERWSRSSMPWADTCTVRVSTTRRRSPRIEDGEGAVFLVPPRTPRSSGYAFDGLTRCLQGGDHTRGLIFCSVSRTLQLL